MMVRSAIVRPWLKAGLSVLLLENERRVAELCSNGEKTEDHTQVTAAALPSGTGYRPADTPVAPHSVQKMTKAGAAVRPARGRGTEEKVEAGNIRTAQPSSGRDSSALLATPGALPVNEWPDTWLALKNRRPLPPRPLVLWTYAGLGEDLTARPDEVRRQVIVRMLMELRHPGGTHVFWPCGLAGEKPEDGPTLFWSGVKLLNPRVLLLFGSDARDALSMPKTLLPFCQERVYGRLVIQLPRPQALAADEQAFQRALAFLSRLLSFCARRSGQAVQA